MQIEAVEIEAFPDFDYGEGWFTFIWKDQFKYSASLQIEMDGHCSREMPIRSGYGLKSLSLEQNRLRLTFSPELAAKLELNEVVEFTFSIEEKTYKELERFVSELNEVTNNRQFRP